ncbi:MAG: AAA family ATPase [Candidatus Symbiobacter sp.]|nr:AAA family ATPase [Candidatus Symbiobacter sp.]
MVNELLVEQVPNLKSVRIDSLTIKNYKGIDELSIEFKKPQIKSDLDISVIGSKNGVGKTSVLECCALLLQSPYFYENNKSKEEFGFRQRRLTRRFRVDESTYNIDLPDLLIKSGKNEATISGSISFPSSDSSAKRTNEKWEITIKREIPYFISNQSSLSNNDELSMREPIGYVDLGEKISRICGISKNPLMDDSVIMLHSYRKMQEGKIEFGDMVSDPENQRRIENNPLSIIKTKIAYLIMQNKGVFDSESKNNRNDNMGEELNKLKSLIEEFANVQYDHLEPNSDNTIDIRLSKGNSDANFSIDGLSSGQKEIISTLYLIYSTSLQKPKVVLLDEPELHLNAEWHSVMIGQLKNLAFNNQYIFATHSKQLMEAVEPYQRIRLEE